MKARHGSGRVPGCSAGQAIVEYIIIFPLLLILIMGAIQMALIYQAKFTLNYATFMGARQGALKNANLTSIKDGVAAGMAPLFMRLSSNSEPALSDLAKARVIAAIEIFNPLTAKVEIISPTQAAFDTLKGSGTEIPNDNLFYRSSGLADGMNIQDANLLKVRVTYCVKLIVPFVNKMIYSLVNGAQGIRNLATELYYSGTTTPATPNMCTTATETFASVSSAVSGLGSGVPGMSTVTSLMGSSLSGPFPTIPLLDWNISGMRIPVTAEAIVRMQSPVQGGNLP